MSALFKKGARVHYSRDRNLAGTIVCSGATLAYVKWDNRNDTTCEALEFLCPAKELT